MKVSPAEFNGIVYRAHHPMWAHLPLSGDGAKLHGGRFNRPGKPALYTSLDLTTAWLEAQQAFPFKAQPMTIVAYQIESMTLVDLTQAKTLTQLSLHTSDLACAWEDLALQKIDPPTWTLADMLHSEGIAGIIVQSYASGCTPENKNLVLWDWLDSATKQIRVIDDFERLSQATDR